MLFLDQLVRLATGNEADLDFLPLPRGCPVIAIQNPDAVLLVSQRARPFPSSRLASEDYRLGFNIS